MTAAVYVRVSKARGQDTASQEPELKRWAEGRGEPVEWYRDQFTGKTMSRPGMDRLMIDLRSRKISTLAVWRLDRLGRTVSGLTALFDELRALHVNLVSLRDGMDLSTPAGRLMASVLASVAAYETEVRGERIAAGLDVARAKGKTFGRPKGSGKGVRSKVTREQLARVLASTAEGRGVAAIARETGLTRPTVYQIQKEAADAPTLLRFSVHQRRNEWPLYYVEAVDLAGAEELVKSQHPADARLEVKPFVGPYPPDSCIHGPTGLRFVLKKPATARNGKTHE